MAPTTTEPTYAANEAAALLMLGVCHGDRVIFPLQNETQTQVDAALLRAIILGLPLPASFHKEIASIDPRYADYCQPGREIYPCMMTGAGLRIANCAVIGRLDLNNSRSADKGPLPPLAFEHCVFSHGTDTLAGDDEVPCIDLRRAHLISLSLRGSRFRHLNAD